MDITNWTTVSKYYSDSYIRADDLPATTIGKWKASKDVGKIYLQILYRSTEEDMQDTLDLLSTAPISNPNLNRKKIQDANLKRRVLKDQIEMTLALHQNRSEPLAKVLSHINSEGEKYQNLTAKKVLDANNASVHETRVGSLLLDCADPSFCNE